MSDAFLAYGDTAASPFRPAPPISPATERERERRKLSANARRQRRTEERGVLACPEGPRLAAMLRWMRSLSIDQADAFLEVLAGESWLLSAPEPFRRVAQRLFGRVIGHIRSQAGIDILDDPMPWDEDGRPMESLHQHITRLLNLR
ncbi:MAG: hypothetical protein WCR49_15480 [Opitutae bacterium]